MHRRLRTQRYTGGQSTAPLNPLGVSSSGNSIGSLGDPGVTPLTSTASLLPVMKIRKWSQLLRVSQDDDDGVIRVDGDPIRRTARSAC
jgi:hypothetical protein